MLNSARTLGANNSLHQKIISYVGWSSASVFGFVLQAAIVAVFWYIVEWVLNGTLQ
jgi:uncharacterized protein HemY